MEDAGSSVRNPETGCRKIRGDRGLLLLKSSRTATTSPRKKEMNSCSNSSLLNILMAQFIYLLSKGMFNLPIVVPVFICSSLKGDQHISSMSKGISLQMFLVRLFRDDRGVKGVNSGARLLLKVQLWSWVAMEDS